MIIIHIFGVYVVTCNATFYVVVSTHPMKVLTKIVTLRQLYATTILVDKISCSTTFKRSYVRHVRETRILE